MARGDIEISALLGEGDLVKGVKKEGCHIEGVTWTIEGFIGLNEGI
jgi:hypothetical protein